MSRICFDYGHGGNDPGACYNGRRECDDVLSLGRAVASEVRRHGITVDETRTNDVAVELDDRSGFENANSYDYFISFHRNAYESERAMGAETYTYINTGEQSKSLAQKIQSSLVSIGFVDRGVKSANFHVLRETKAPAVLVEMGFIDNSGDNSLFDVKRNEIMRALAGAILEQLCVGYVEPSVQAQPQIRQNLFRVMAGSYAVRENAENEVQKLKAAGFDATIMIFNK